MMCQLHCHAWTLYELPASPSAHERLHFFHRESAIFVLIHAFENALVGGLKLLQRNRAVGVHQAEHHPHHHAGPYGSALLPSHAAVHRIPTHHASAPHAATHHATPHHALWLDLLGLTGLGSLLSLSGCFGRHTTKRNSSERNAEHKNLPTHVDASDLL